jgi:hypothetical protein
VRGPSVRRQDISPYPVDDAQVEVNERIADESGGADIINNALHIVGEIKRFLYPRDAELPLSV